MLFRLILSTLTLLSTLSLATSPSPLEAAADIEARAPSAEAGADPVPIVPAPGTSKTDQSLQKRACRCAGVPRNGLYCGYCTCTRGFTIGGSKYCTNEDVSFDEVAWCNTAGGCDSYGVRTSCKNRNGPCNGAQSRIMLEREAEPDAMPEPEAGPEAESEEAKV